MATNRDIYEKFRNGESLTDGELRFGVKFFGKLATDLFTLGPVFRLQANELRNVATTMAGFLEHRQSRFTRKK